MNQLVAPNRMARAIKSLSRLEKIAMSRTAPIAHRTTAGQKKARHGRSAQMTPTMISVLG